MSPSPRTERRFRPVRDLPAAIWLLLVVVSTVVHPWVPAPRWLMIHLLLLGAITHAILVWSRYFTDALLHLPAVPGERRTESARLVLVNLGTVVVVAGVLGSAWPVTTIGATAIVAAVGWHGVDLFLRLRRALPGRFAVTVRYYVAAACFLPLGAVLGTSLAHGFGDPTHEQVKLAHATLNVLGWMGLTVAGTLLTLWPTMLRTRIAEGAERASRRALPVLAGSVLLAAAGAVAGLRVLAGAGLLAYVAGLALAAVPMVRAARRKPPRTFAPLSVAAGVLWWAGSVLALGVSVLLAPDWGVAADRFAWLSPYLAAGFGAQVLLGALSYLLPVSVSRGPASVRAANAVMDRGAALRITLVNSALLVCLLPVPSLVRVLASLLVLGGLASFLPLMVLTVRAAHRPPDGPSTETGTGAATGPAGRPRPRGPRAAEGERPAGQRAGQAVTGLAAVALAVTVGVALDPLALGGTGGVSAAAGAGASGSTTTVRVEAEDMRFSPSRIEVPAGDRLVIEVHNTDPADVHDLVLDSGADSGRLSPGESTTLDVGVVGRDLEGWCSVVGHRQMGMVLDVVVTGGAAPATDDGGGGVPEVDLTAEPGPDFEARDARLGDPPGREVHRHTFRVSELEQEVAPGVSQLRWTFGGTAPGPVLHGTVGDEFVIRLVNDGTIGHSIDFHAGALAPDRPMRTIPPGEELVYRFTAERAGIWMYHCSTEPMTTHISAGMFGAVVIEPPDLPEVDRSYLLVQSEIHLGEDGGPVDAAKAASDDPDLVVFNGHANQYDHEPLRARVGERVRVWVLAAGPNRGTSFHVIGGQFDATYLEGAWQLRRGSPGGAQALALAPAQGGFVELTFPEPGSYPFVSHVMADAERGAHGLFRVTR